MRNIVNATAAADTTADATATADATVDTKATELPEEPDALPAKRRKILHQEKAVVAASGNSRSIKFLNVDIAGLQETYLGQIIAPLGGQVKRAAMEASSADGSPTFSRMSGIQEWKNAVGRD